MVLGAYEEHVLRPRRRAKARADKAEKERDEVVKELEEGRAWNKRRLQAQAHGEPFDEPYPDTEPESCGQRQLFWPLCANYFGRSGSGVIVVCNCRSCACRPCASLVR